MPEPITTPVVLTHLQVVHPALMLAKVADLTFVNTGVRFPRIATYANWDLAGYCRMAAASPGSITSSRNAGDSC